LASSAGRVSSWNERAVSGSSDRLNWSFHRRQQPHSPRTDGRRLSVRAAASEVMAEDDEVFVSADRRYFVLLEE
jgi:hypothetical protein